MHRDTESRAKRIGDIVGIASALLGTILLHWNMFGGDQYFPLRFLLTPFGDPVAFALFLGALVMLIVKIVRAVRDRDWPQLFPPAPAAAAAAEADPVAGFLGDATKVAPRRSAPSAEGMVTRRALKAAAITALGQSLFMIVFPVALLPISAVIFIIALALIGFFYAVARALRLRAEA